MARLSGAPYQQVVTFSNFQSFVARVVSVAAAGTPVQLPDIPVPDGAELSIRARITNGFRRVYVSDSPVNATDPATRIELRAGETIGLRVANADVVFVDASANGAAIELLVEQ